MKNNGVSLAEGIDLIIIIIIIIKSMAEGNFCHVLYNDVNPPVSMNFTNDKVGLQEIQFQQ